MDSSLNLILSAINVGLTAIKSIADIPGVSTLPYAAALSSGVDLIQRLAAVGGDVLPIVERIRATFSQPEISESDLAALNADIAAGRAALHAPLPPAEEGEPED